VHPPHVIAIVDLAGSSRIEIPDGEIDDLTLSDKIALWLTGVAFLIGMV
jgi:hypothetical protein